jgi:oligopeptide transport system permease protein
MAVSEQSVPAAKVVNLQPTAYVKGESLWLGAWKRMRRNRMAVLSIIIIVLVVLMALLAPFLAPQSYSRQTLVDNNAAPQWIIDVFPNLKSKEDGGWVTISDKYSLGADSLGRDILSRIIYGARVSLAVAAVGPLTSALIGLAVGLIAGYLGGWTDNFLMRIVDLMYAFPTLLFVILLMSFFRTSFAQPDEGTIQAALGKLDSRTGGMLFIFIGIGLTSWMQMARLVRGQVLSIREKEYIEAAISIGTPKSSIILRHVLPNILGPIIVAETLTIPVYISYEAFLSFIGVGVQPPTPSWGMMIAEGSRAINSYPYQALFPALALALVMFAFNFLGDGLRDAFDPRSNSKKM